jgi:DNA-binding transcriptional LysR family regulator
LGIDLAVRVGSLADSSLLATRVGSPRGIVCGNLAYFAQRDTPRSPDELTSHDCVTFEGLPSRPPWAFKTGKSNTPVAVRSRLVVNTAEAAIASLGLTRAFSHQVAAAVQSAALTVVLQQFEPEPSPVNLIHAGGLAPLKPRAFLDHAAPRLKAMLRRNG